MPSVIDLPVEVGRTALTFAPWLTRIPVLGRIFTLLYPNGGDEAAAIRKLQDLVKAKELDRKTRRDRVARYVLKANDAMQCAEDAIMNGGFLLSFGKGILNTVAGISGQDGADLLIEQIYACIERKTLPQTSRRRKKVGKTWYGRPAKGHGRGRG